jgi:hypothetical protein
MRINLVVIASVLLGSWGVERAMAHPGAGIVVDEQGQVYFTDSGRGIVKIAATGKWERITSAPDGHWLAIDLDGSFSRAQPHFFRRTTPDGVKPALIFAGGGSPIALNGHDGSLYYASGPDTFDPGGLELARESPRGELSHVSPELKQQLARIDDGITSLAVGPADGAIYVGSWTGVFKVSPDGRLTTIVQPIHVDDCDADPADHDPARPMPYLRGLAISANGTIYAAATSCHRVLKITPDGRQVSIALKCERPWTATGVAVHDGRLYVLEYTNANGPATEGWRPRVRMVAPDGNVSTLVTLPDAPTTRRTTSPPIQP